MKQLLKITLPLVGRAGIVKYIFLGLTSGIANFLLINGVTRFVSYLVTGSYTAVSIDYILIFLFILLLFIWARKTLTLFSISVSQRITWTLRMQILSLALDSNYQQLSARKNMIRASVLSDASALTGASMTTIDFLIQTIMAVSCLIYLSSISWILFLITLVVASLGCGLYYFSSKAAFKRFEKTRKIENLFQANLNDILVGFKEIYMEPRKGKYIYEHRVAANARDSYNHSLTALISLSNNQIIGQILFYLLLASILLVFSVVLKISPDKIVGFAFALLYLLGAVSTLMSLLPTLMSAKVASKQVMELKAVLERENAGEPVSAEYFPNNNFENLTVQNLEFRYGILEADFAIGPVSLTIQKGDVIFIYGANGSGKSTLVHSILGLCIPTAGEIYVNETPVSDVNNPDYRNHFSVVFTDFYLFTEILCEEKVDLEKWNFYLHLFEIEGKVKLEGNNFSTTDLSAGQRKRLALIIALLEEKPILVMDEWAADQDPYFRKKFYTEIIPFLKKNGITIIAITHDDKYYHCADRIYKMDEGLLYEDSIDHHRLVLIDK